MEERKESKGNTAFYSCFLFFFHKEKEEMQIIPRLSLGDQYNKIIWNKTEKV